MAEERVLSWGKCLIKFTNLTDNKAVSLPVPKEASTKLEPQEGEVQTAKEEGGDVIATRRKGNTYTLSFELFYDSALDAQAEVKALLMDGTRDAYYKIEIIPENKDALSITINRASISVTHAFDTNEGIMKRIKCDALKPTEAGKATLEFAKQTAQ